MLKARNLDDQSYEEIVKTAVGRLPWLCPAWTDHNAHDPGITILELMAWYKELQQYHMNQLTDGLRRALLKLAGEAPRPAAPARCPVEIGPEDPPRPAGTRLRTAEGILFELEEPIPAERPRVAQVFVTRGGRRTDVGQMLAVRRLTFQPFEAAGEEPGALSVGLSGWRGGPVRLWFEVEEPEGVPRNPFSGSEQVPREICWQCTGAAGTRLLQDGTHALSRSGYVTLAPEGEWPRGADGLHWLDITLEDPGCEEAVRLSGLTAGRYRAIQQETWAKRYSFQAQSGEGWTALLPEGQARESELAVFLRGEAGWAQTDRWQAALYPEGRRVAVDTAAAVQDGADNVLILSLDPLRLHSLLFDAKGLPGETLRLDLEGRIVLREGFTLLCETLDRDGGVRPMLWRCVEDLTACGPRDRVFTYDPLRETVTFGDGEHGALLRPGKGAVLAADLVVTCGSGGNIPGGCALCFEEDGLAVSHGPAVGGAGEEPLEETQGRLLRRLSATCKCVSTADYERLARQTPGLRVAAAKALPAYDPEEPTGYSSIPTVTVVVVPAGQGERPAPDGRFLAAVQRQLDRYRPIGTRVVAAGPVYVEVAVSVTLRTGESGLEKPAAQAIQAYLAQTGIGGVLRAGEVQAALRTLPGVLQVREAEVRCTAPGCRKTGRGEITLPCRAIPRLKNLRVFYLPPEASGR